MYKDKAKQKEANRLAKQRNRAKNRALPENAVIEPKNNAQDYAGCNIPVIPIVSHTQNVIPDSHTLTYNTNGPAGRPHRVSVPGDSDYVGVMSQDQAGNWICKDPGIVELTDQDYISARNAATRERLKNTPIAELIASKVYIPVWRYAQDNMNMCN